MTVHDDRSWQRWLTLLDAYIAEHGNPYPPQGYTAPTGERLGKWLATITWAHRSGHSRMTADRTEDLAARGIDTDSTWFERHWKNRLDELAAYVAEHGDGLVPHSDSGLGLWVKRMRQQYRAGTLTPTQVRQLEDVGMVWIPREQWARWSQHGWSLHRIAAASGVTEAAVHEQLASRSAE